MNRKAALVQFLRSFQAIAIHILCIGGSTALTVGLLEGNAPPDALAGICFLLASYPVLLGLAWWQFNDDATLLVINQRHTSDEEGLNSATRPVGTKEES
ncbi:MAG: hypothetical protein KDB00_07745 [Planctomycetales bacterium]|nr:hypothetical protein [Planctomycetales bacterium]